MNKKAMKAVWGIVTLALLLLGVVGCSGRMEQSETVGQTGVKDTQNTLGGLQIAEEGDYGSVSLNGTDYELTQPVKSYLFIGTDLSGNEEAVGEEYQGSMADVLMVIVVNEEEKTYGILQLNRDTITKVPLLLKDGTANASAKLQLCTAHWYGADKKASCENTVVTVEKMLGGIKIDGYYALQMAGIGMLNQAVGGVTMTFEADFTEVDPAMKQGATLTLTDEQAEKLIRARYEMTDDRNTLRMERQRAFLNAFMKQVQEKNAENPDFIIQLYDRLHPFSTENLNMNELSRLLKNTKEYRFTGLFTIDGESKIGQRLHDGLDHWEFIMDKNSLEQVMKDLYPLSEVEETDEEETEEYPMEEEEE